MATRVRKSAVCAERRNDLLDLLTSVATIESHMRCTPFNFIEVECELQYMRTRILQMVQGG